MFVFLGVTLSGTFSRAVEQPKYQVIERYKNIEVRDYPQMIVAEVNVTGDRNAAIQKGFRLIANYIFGNNSTSQNTEATSIVTHKEGEKIAMTAPVTQQSEGDGWRVQFIMPANYTLETLPNPNAPEVALKRVHAGRRAVIGFSGLAGDESLIRHTAELNSFISATGLKVTSKPTYAFYNPPWTLPFLRHNEIMIDVEIKDNK